MAISMFGAACTRGSVDFKSFPSPATDIPFKEGEATRVATLAGGCFWCTEGVYQQIPGVLGVFIDEQQISSLERKMEERGYLEGSEMATTFNMLRANDLIWSFVVNNYLMGKQPFPFDLLYWNSDSTRMPYKMHSFYLRNMYMNNLLKEPGGITLAGVPIDINTIKTPSYFISTIEDHIAPWKSVYLGAKRMAGPTRFVLGGSGHIAGIVNPPAANKYCYWTKDSKRLPETPDEWFEGAEQHQGSWWTDWQEWVTQLDNSKVPARDPAKGKLKVVEDAPGSFVKFRLDSQPAVADKVVDKAVNPAAEDKVEVKTEVKAEVKAKAKPKTKPKA